MENIDYYLIIIVSYEELNLKNFFQFLNFWIFEIFFKVWSFIASHYWSSRSSPPDCVAIFWMSLYFVVTGNFSPRFKVHLVLIEPRLGSQQIS